MYGELLIKVIETIIREQLENIIEETQYLLGVQRFITKKLRNKYMDIIFFININNRTMSRLKQISTISYLIIFQFCSS